MSFGLSSKKRHYEKSGLIEEVMGDETGRVSQKQQMI